MAKKPNLGQINSTVFTASQLNAAFTKIDNAFENTLSLDGSTPNAMGADLDMNGNDIINTGVYYGQSIDVEEAVIGGKLFTGTLTWRSDWLTSTSYQKLDLVKKDGNVYVCLEEHTSGVFATDLSSSKWEVFIESAGGGGVEDHGDLTGLEDDDHTQYHNDTRGDVRYYTKAQVDSSLSGKANTSHTHSASDIASGTLDTARIADGSIGLTKLVDITNQIANQALAQVSTSTLKGRATAGTGNVEDLTGTQATAMLDAFVGSGASHKKGLVPDPGATAGGTRYLNEDGSWTKRPYDLNLFVGGLTTNSELVFRMKTMTEFTLPASLTGSYGTAATASTGTVAFDLLKNGVSFGTLTFTASGAGVFTAASSTSFAVGDVLSIVAPATADTTLADISINLKGSAT